MRSAGWRRWRDGPMVLVVCVLAAFGAGRARADGGSWGAIASQSQVYGYSFGWGSRDAAEQAARAQCDRAQARTVRAGQGASAGPCEVRSYFNRSCGAFALGNHTEWGAASAAGAAAAGRAAIEQCDAHLPTEPCKAVLAVCSPGGVQLDAHAARR